ncbi:hypothetical protein QF030_003824 [Streptomyces rishiriensis]|uniref:Tyr recombinase domain-containing protein n=1 Tax=Streptomyces rishiriensis TaxID=68264 RepID=A0ABU0NR58_STRRH|nr:hypothetical protein [Streptomyces rishiriensis]
MVRLHDARHGCATLLTAAGVARRVTREILGHSQISIPMDVYTHVVHDTPREAISHMDRLPSAACRPLPYPSLSSLILLVLVRDPEPNEAEGDVAWLSRGDS